MNFKLFELDKTLKNFLVAILIVLTTGLVVGLIYLNYTTDYTRREQHKDLTEQIMIMEWMILIFLTTIQNQFLRY